MVTTTKRLTKSELARRSVGWQEKVGRQSALEAAHAE